ncbi:MAG: polysaccharide ABC transporter ATP-binding protein [Bacteroidales bacterium]
MDTVIKVERLHKKFCRSLKRSMFYGSVDMFRSMLNMQDKETELRKAEFWALQDINFELKRGETLGLIGQNGCGKTTLLRLLNGIFPPDNGRITINGRIGALIAVGAGFHPHMTGRENIFLNGTILGMTKADIRRNLDAIIDFADIGEFIDSPVSTYSSGMTIRLGFAIAIHCAPNIVLIDEILAVGDANFQRKCLEKVKELRKNQGVSFILVSHNIQNIEAMSNTVILLEKGQLLIADTPQNVIPYYELLLSKKNESINEQIPFNPNQGKLNMIFQYKQWGTRSEIYLDDISLINQQGISTLLVHSDDPVTLDLNITINEDLEEVLFYLRIYYVYDKNNYYHENNIACLGMRKKMAFKKGKFNIKIFFDKLQLKTGSYFIKPYFYDWTFSQPYSPACYGYFDVTKEYPTLLSKEHPIYWKDPEIQISEM